MLRAAGCRQRAAGGARLHRLTSVPGRRARSHRGRQQPCYDPGGTGNACAGHARGRAPALARAPGLLLGMSNQRGFCAAISALVCPGGAAPHPRRRQESILSLTCYDLDCGAGLRATLNAQQMQQRLDSCSQQQLQHSSRRELRIL